MSRTILFVDDHPIYREGIERTLSRTLDDLLIKTAGCFLEAVTILEQSPIVDLCVTDQRLPDGMGVELVALIRARFPTVASGILSAEVTPTLCASVRRHGGVACLSKERDGGAIAEAIEILFEGGEVFDDKSGLAGSPLTPRRCEIVRMAAEGLADKQICAHLAVTESAVRNHWLHIFRRLGVANRTEAVTRALRLGLI